MNDTREAASSATEREWPDWIDEIAIDPTGEVWGFEGGCYWLSDGWVPVDDFDGLRYEFLGCDKPISVEAARTMHFRRVRDAAPPPGGS